MATSEIEKYAIKLELSSITKSLDALYERGAANAGFAKEIDDLRTRVKIMETKLAAKT